MTRHPEPGIPSSADYRGRAQRIVDRVLPKLPTAHGFHDPAGFIAASRRDGERQRLFWRTFARLRAKAEGGVPYLTLPKDSPAVADSIMGQVARELLNDAELLRLAAQHRKFNRRRAA